MKIMKCARTAHTPEVVLDTEAGTLLIEGECYPENPATFFQPVIGAVQMVLASGSLKQFHARFRLAYVNSASTKSMRQLFLILNEAAKAGCNVDVAWEFDEDDDAIQDLGEDLMYGLGIPYLAFHETPYVA
ncbi:MAG TPA: DUF1987 domain-containing protein [Noviherbaspirillum sp.]|nr:DUF1987 domain-containing protein [Noviherbaspirillum sp.]